MQQNEKEIAEMIDPFEKAKSILTDVHVSHIALLIEMEPHQPTDDLREKIELIIGGFIQQNQHLNNNKIHDEVKDLFRGKKSIDQISPDTRRLVQMRANRLGINWPPENDQLKKIVSYGGYYAEDTHQSKSRRRQRLKPLLFAPQKTKSPRRLEPAECLAKALKVVYESVTGSAAAKIVRRTETKRKGPSYGPFGNLLKYVLTICGAPHINIESMLKRLNDKEEGQSEQNVEQKSAGDAGELQHVAT